MTLGQIKTYTRKLFLFKSIHPIRLLKQVYEFPIDYFIKKGKSYPPFHIVLFITLRCNASCKMCNLAEYLNKDRDELSLKEIEKFIKSVKKFRPSIILFGGEPLLRKDFLQILALVKENNLSCGIFTNGTLLDEKKIKEMVRLGIDFIVFSLQGPEKIHDRILRVPGAYKKMVKNISLYQKYRKSGNKSIIHATITEFNINHLEDIIKIGEEHNVDLVRFGHPTFFTKNDIRAHDVFVKTVMPGEKIEGISYSYNPEKMKSTFIKNIRKIKRNKKRHKVPIAFTPELTDEELKSWYSSSFKSKRKCYWVWRALFVFPNGDVYPCESLHFKIGNIKKQSFLKIWNNKKYMKLRRVLKKGLFPACARCCKL